MVTTLVTNFSKDITLSSRLAAGRVFGTSIGDCGAIELEEVKEGFEATNLQYPSPPKINTAIRIKGRNLIT